LYQIAHYFFIDGKIGRLIREFVLEFFVAYFICSRRASFVEEEVFRCSRWAFVRVTLGYKDLALGLSFCYVVSKYVLSLFFYLNGISREDDERAFVLGVLFSFLGSIERTFVEMSHNVIHLGSQERPIVDFAGDFKAKTGRLRKAR